MLTILLCLLAAIAIHRLWHYEDIFAPLRSLLGASMFLDPTKTPILIAPAVAAVSLIPSPWTEWGLAIMACYPLLRGAVFIYGKYDPPPAPCSACQKKSADMQNKMLTLQAKLRPWEKRIIAVGASPDELIKLAITQKKWGIVVPVVVGSKIPKSPLKNLMYMEVYTPNVNDTVTNFMEIVFNGGNATFVLYDTPNLPLWTDVIKRVGTMMAVAWVHKTHYPPDGLPPHHSVVAPSEPTDKMIIATKPMTH
jgi:hypothetical protein